MLSAAYTRKASLDVNRHDATIQSFCLTFEQPFDWNTLATWLDLLAAYRGDNLLRVKGLVGIRKRKSPRDRLNLFSRRSSRKPCVAPACA